MTDANPARLGLKNGGTDDRELFLKVATGEVAAAYNSNCLMKDWVRSRNITSGKSAQFLATGRSSARYHTPGALITGANFALDEKVLTIDGMLIADHFVANIDEAMAHYDVSSEITTQMGQALGQTYDRNMFSLAVKAARDPSGLGKGNVDQADAVSVNIGATPTSDDIINAVLDGAQSFAEKNIPDNDRVLVLSPKYYYKLVRNDKLLNAFFNPGGNGSFSGAVLKDAGGFPVVMSNNLALDHTNSVTQQKYPDYNSKYAVDASATVGLLLHKSALATIKLLDIQSEMDYQIERQGTLWVSKMLLGNGVIRPEGIYELKGCLIAKKIWGEVFIHLSPFQFQ